MTLFELKKPTEVEKDYLKTMKKDLINRIIFDTKLSDQVRNILIPGCNTLHPDYSRIDSLLIAEPKVLFDLNTTIHDEIKKLKKEERASRKLLNKIFNYDGIYNTSNKSKAYKLSLRIGAKTCCYCNRQYTFTIVTGNNKNKDNRITRPAFDHWFPKSLYPLLSISLYNLIPSCNICNSSAKGQHDMDLVEYIHPYVHLPNHPKIEFQAVPSTENDKLWTTKIERSENTPEDKTIKMFCLDDIYKEHDTLELKDIMDFKENYPDGYIDELIELLKTNSTNLSFTTKDVYRMLFGVEHDDEKNLDRPFGKMKNDILKNILHIKDRKQKVHM